ncbi:MAG TPA: ABC transporter ATP-binding protein [Nitriliruptorales bacterium]|nr:ABC transporter ATP-binding protein [Nitriliruptorales bacterium]
MSLQAQLSHRLGPLRLEVELHVARGVVTALLGPNGAGKTTLLRLLAGLLAPDAGRIDLDGRTLEDTAAGVRLPPPLRGVGFVFQDHLLFPHLSALDNVAFGPRARGVPRSDARRHASDWLVRVGLNDHAQARPRELSGGQAQRVALARALAAGPDLLLMDEPLAALDAESRLTVRGVLRDHLARFSGVCLLVTHEPIDAITLADQLVILEDGHIVQQGPVDVVARQPRSPWVARLVGLNLYRGRADGSHVRLDGGATLAAGTRRFGEVFAVVHPRAVALHRHRPEGSPRNVWRGHVDGLEAHGDRVRVHVDAAVAIVAEVTPAAAAELDLAAGGPVWVSVKASEVELFGA